MAPSFEYTPGEDIDGWTDLSWMQTEAAGHRIVSPQRERSQITCYDRRIIDLRQDAENRCPTAGIGRMILTFTASPARAFRAPSKVS